MADDITRATINISTEYITEVLKKHFAEKSIDIVALKYEIQHDTGPFGNGDKVRGAKLTIKIA